MYINLMCRWLDTARTDLLWLWLVKCLFCTFQIFLWHTWMTYSFRLWCSLHNSLNSSYQAYISGVLCKVIQKFLWAQVRDFIMINHLTHRAFSYCDAMTADTMIMMHFEQWWHLQGFYSQKLYTLLSQVEQTLFVYLFLRFFIWY
jgi:hypothetical protein